jgi:hypothetical protein
VRELIEEEGFLFSDQIVGSLYRFALMPNKQNKQNKQTKHLVEERKGKERKGKKHLERNAVCG